MNALFHRILTALAAVLLTVTTASAYDFEADGIYYLYGRRGHDTDSTYVYVTYGKHKYAGHITIPSKVTHNAKESYVYGVGYEAFMDCTDLTSVTLEKGVSNISARAFKNSGLQQLELHTNRLSEIGAEAFYGTQIQKLDLSGGSPTTIYDYAFYNTPLREVNIPGTRYISEYAFSKTQLREITLSDDMRMIRPCAFSNSPLQKVNIPRWVKYIGSGAFSGTQITDIYIWSYWLYDLDSDLFADCESLLNATLDCDDLWQTHELRDPKYSGIFPMFSNCPNLITTGIKGKIANIPAGFFKNVKIRELHLGENMQVISGAAFVNSSIENIYFLSPYPPQIRDAQEWYSYFSQDEDSAPRFSIDDCVTAHIPEGSKEAFLNSNLSSIFKNINYIDDLPVPSEGSIDDVVVDNDTEITVTDGRIIAGGVVEVYAPDGRLVGRGLSDDLPTLTPGLYIVRTPSATKKIMVR